MFRDQQTAGQLRRPEGSVKIKINCYSIVHYSVEEPTDFKAATSTIRQYKKVMIKIRLARMKYYEIVIIGRKEMRG